MPKNAPTAAQAARQDARAGAKYTAALRARTAGTAAPEDMQVLQFLSKASTSFRRLVGCAAAVWAQDGQRVLLLQEQDSFWELTTPRRGRGRKVEEPTPPEPQTITLWEAGDGQGELAHHACLWQRYVRSSDGRGMPESDRTQIKEVLAEARGRYDTVVLLPQHGWAYPDRELPTAHVVLAEVDQFPHSDCLAVLPETREEHGSPLSPEQSAAVLRERCLRFLCGPSSLKTRLNGVVWQTYGKPSVEADYLAAVDRDMERAGLHTLGWVIHQSWPSTQHQLPTPEQLLDPAFVEPYRLVAERMRAALGPV